MIVEIPPSNFLHPHSYSCISARFKLPLLAHFLRLVQDHPPADHPTSEVRTQSRRIITVNEVAPAHVFRHTGVGIISLSAFIQWRDELELLFSRFGMQEAVQQLASSVCIPACN